MFPLLAVLPIVSIVEPVGVVNVVTELLVEVDVLEVEVCPLPLPRTLGIVPVVAVCCATRVRVTSRMLIKMRLECHVDLQLIGPQTRVV